MKPVAAAAVILLLACACLCSVAYATPMGAPSFPYWREPISFNFSALVGYGQRDMRVLDFKKTKKGVHRQDEMNSFHFLTKIGLAPTNFLEFYGIIGAADLQRDDGNYKGSLSPAFGVGLRPILLPSFWDVETDLFIALDGQYLNVATEDDGVGAVFHEAQASLIVGYTFKERIAPYGGVKYDWAAVKGEKAHDDMRGILDVAAFIGCDYLITDEVFFNVDLTIFSETRIYGGVGYKY